MIPFTLQFWSHHVFHLDPHGKNHEYKFGQRGLRGLSKKYPKAEVRIKKMEGRKPNKHHKKDVTTLKMTGSDETDQLSLSLHSFCTRLVSFPHGMAISAIF